MANNARRESTPQREIGNILCQGAGGRQSSFGNPPLKTDRMSVAQLRLGDFLKEERHKAESVQATARGKMTFEQALKTYRERLKADVSLKDRSKEYREERIAALLSAQSWPELSDMDVLTHFKDRLS